MGPIGKNWSIKWNKKTLWSVLEPCPLGHGGAEGDSKRSIFGQREHRLLVGKMSGIVDFPYFGIILQVCALKCPDSNPINLFVYAVYTTSRLGFGVLIDWRALEVLKLSVPRFVSTSLCLSLSSGQEFPKSTLREGEQQEGKWAFGPIKF